jgi:hypothetical protein
MTRGEAELTWPEDLGELLDGIPEPVSDRVLLDPGYCDHLARVSDALSDGFGGLAAEVRERLWRPPFFVVLRGLTFDPGDLLFAILASRIGRLLEPHPDPTFTVFRRLTPGRSTRTADWGVLTEWLHTDSTNWRIPHDITMMLCQKPDQSGEGASLVLPLDDALTEIDASLGRGVIDRLRDEAYPWAVDTTLGGGVVWAPVLSQSGIRWQPFRNAEAAWRDGSECGPQTMGFLRAVDEVMRESRLLREFALAENDLMVINNRYVMHARRAVPEAGRSERVLVHCKANATGPRPRAGSVLGSVVPVAD